MKKILLTLSTIGLLLDLSAKEIVSNIEPYRSFYVTAETSGNITFVNLNKENKVSKNESIIKIDSEKETVEFNSLKNKIINYKQIVKNKKIILDGVLKIKSKSKFEKLIETNNFLNTKNILLDLEQRMALLKIALSKKTVKASNLYIEDILVSQNEFVTIGKKLIKVSDISKKILNFYLTSEEIVKLNKGQYKLFIDKKDVTKNWNILSISKVKDKTYVSGYKVKMSNEEEIQLSQMVIMKI